MSNHCDGHDDMVDNFTRRIERVEGWEKESDRILTSMQGMVRQMAEAVQDQRNMVREMKKEITATQALSQDTSRGLGLLEKKVDGHHASVVKWMKGLAVAGLMFIGGDKLGPLMIKLFFG